MGRFDKILLTDIEQHLVAHREELAGQFHVALRATVFSHRPSIRPSSLKQIAAEEAEGFFNFLQGGETSEVQAQGAQRAREGIGEAGVLRMGSALRRFCIAHLEAGWQQGGLETAEAYANDFLVGFAQGREAIILEEQELTRAALQNALGRYTLRLQTASEVSRAVSFTLDLGELLPRMVELVRERFALYYVGIFLLDEIGRYAVLRAGTGEAGREMLAAGHKLELGGQSMIGQCVAERQARIALDVGQEAVRFDNPVLSQTRSEMALPLVSRGEAIGAVTIQSAEASAFSTEDITLFQTVADQLANAIQNARLFEQSHLALLRTTALYQANRSVTTFESLPEVFQQITDGVAEALPADRVLMIAFDLDAGEVTNYARGGPGAERAPRVPFEDLSVGLSGWVLRELKPALSPKTVPDPREGPEVQKQRIANRAGAIIVVPVLYRGEVLGTLTAVNLLTQPDFTEEDVSLMEAMANQAATAIQNARLFGQTQAALLRTETLYQANRLVTTFESLPEVFQQITDGVAEALPADRVLLLTFDLEARQVTHYARGGPGAERAPRVSFEDLSGGLSGWVLRELKPALAPKGVPDPREGPKAQKQRIANQAGAMIVVPVLYREELLGTLTAVNLLTQPDFTEEDVSLMEAIANQAATAIQNARLFGQTQAALLRTETLYQANRLVTTFESLPEVFQQITDGVAEALPADRVLLLTFDLEARQVTHYAYGGAGAEKLGPAPFEDFEGGLSGWVLRELKPAFSPKGALDPRESAVAQQGRIDHDVGAVIVVPLLYRGEILGTLTAINSLAQPDFVEEDVTLMESLANQAATAIQNAQLFEQHQQSLRVAETRAQRLQAAAEVSRAASSTLEMNELLQQAVTLIHERFAFKCAGIFLLDDTEQWVILRAGAGEVEKMDHRLEVAGESLVGACITQSKTQLASLEDTSEAALPLIAHGKVSGAMLVRAVGDTAFSTEDIIALQTMADQLANAITNARLFAESQSRFEELQKLQRQMTGEAWAEYTGAQRVVGYTYDLSQLTPLETPAAVPNIPAFSRGEIVTQQGEDGATLLAPITLHGESIGWLNFEETERARDWSADDIAVIEAVREQLALTLENRLLFEQTATALAETSTLYEIGQHISEAQNAEDILQATVEGLSRRPEPDYVMVGVQEPPRSLRIGYDWMRTATESRRDKIYPLEYWQQLREIIEREGRFVTEDVENEPRLAEATRHFYRPAGLHGMAAFPLRVQNETYRTLHIHTTEPHEFSPEELRFYETVIQSAAVALENRLLLQTTQQEAARRALLNEVIGTAAASLNPEELLHNVSRLITERLSMPTMIWLWDGKRASPTIIYRHDGTQMLLQEELSLRPAEMPGIGKAIRARGPILWEFAAPPYRSAQFEHLVDALSLQEIFAVPLMIRDTLHGVMVLGRQVGHEAIDDNDMTFMRSAAVNIGVALDNATLYQDAQETAEQLREVDRLKSEFLANMSHELRTPLNSIIGFSRVILKGIDGPITEFQKTDLEAIYESGRHLLGLINDILDISKIEAGKMEFIFEPVDLKKLIKGTLATSIALVKDKPIELQQDVPEELPIILADERRIRQVVLNLLGNAAKFTEVGFIRVFATYNDREVVVGVKDTGIGIPVDKYSAVFREFEQVDSSSTRSYGGTGLGLPVTKKFVEAHGGRIWFESEVGVGSTFYVALPIEGPAPQRPEDVEAQARADENLTVLTVDDDEGVITLFRRYLEKQGYRVVGLTHSERVVEEAKRLQPYAITLDIIMPDKNGWEVIRELKSDPETRNIPIIVCSIVSDTQKGLSLGVADYLVKPILEQDLLDALERFSEGQDTSHVLVVDDNADDRKLLRRILEDAGYVVREAAGGAAAIVMIIEQPPDLVVLDLMMPEVDGFAVLENLKGHELTRQIPVVVVTAKELTVEEQTLLDEGVEALLQKALFDQEQLLQDVAAALRRLSFAGT